MRAALACRAAATVASPRGAAVPGPPAAVLAGTRLRRPMGGTRTTGGTVRRRTAAVTGRPVPRATAPRSGRDGAAAGIWALRPARAPAGQAAG
jgi:hypothetical protein